MWEVLHGAEGWAVRTPEGGREEVGLWSRAQQTVEMLRGRRTGLRGEV
ncbi:MAG: hypothetical protein ACFFDE_05450 [Promethearchaeota archaeon]